MLNSKVLFLGLVGINLLGGGLFLIRSAHLQSSKITFDTYNNTSNTIKVDVSGAVVNPGIYLLSETSRVEDAIASAGGFLATADQVWVGQYLNKSQTVSDGQKIYIPQISEAKINKNLVSINAGSKLALISLRGIGDVTADKIIAARPYTNLDELWVKKIISKKVFEGIKNQISLW